VRTLKADGHYVVPPTEGVSVTTGAWDVGYGPSVETVLRHARHVYMKRLPDEYWSEATATPPRDPARVAASQIAVAALEG